MSRPAPALTRDGNKVRFVPLAAPSGYAVGSLAASQEMLQTRPMTICRWLATGLIFAVASLTPTAEPPGPVAFEAEIRAFEAADQISSAPMTPVLFVGSSSFRLWTNLPAAFPQWVVLNRGFGGSTMAHLLHHYDRLILPHHPRLIVVYEGDNDLEKGSDVDQILSDFREFVRRVARDRPQTPVVLLAVKPSPSRRQQLAAQQKLNAGLLRLAGDHPLVVFADTHFPILGLDGEPDPRFFLADRLHLNEVGYAHWTPVIAQALRLADTLRPPQAP